VGTLVEMSRNTDMILMGTDCAVQHLIERGEMQRLEIDGFDRTKGLSSAYGLVRMAGRTLSPAAELLCDMLLKHKQDAAS
jgi:DNA-binding transcriptional LysR family regulator